MSPINIAIIGTVICFILIFLRVPIAFAFGIVGFCGVWLFQGLQPALTILGTIPYTTMSMYTWSVIPMYALLGYIARYSKLGEEFYEGIRRWVGSFRGGLASAIVIANTGFGAVSGDSLGAAATFTAMTLPELRKYKYSDSLTLGSIAGSTLLAQFIPPSFVFIIYGALTGTSIGKLFIAGIFPGLILASLYITTIYFMCQRNPAMGPPGPKTTWKDKIRAGSGMWAITVIFVVIIGGLYLGLFTPTEAGGAATFVVIVLGIARRRLSWGSFEAALIETGLLVAMVGFMLIGCMIFNLFLALTGAPAAVQKLVGGVTESPIGVLFLMSGIFFLLGMFMDGLAIMLLLIPMFFSIVTGMGIDPILFGVVATIATIMGNITPPFGLSVFVIAGVAKDVPISTIFRGAVPFVLAMVMLLILVIFFPQISLFLPQRMMGQ